MPDQPTTRFLTKMLRSGAMPFAQAGHGFGASIASGMAESFALISSRDSRLSYLDQSTGFTSMQQAEPSPISQHEPDPDGATSSEGARFRSAEDEAVTMSGRDAASQGLPEEAAGEYAAPVPAPSFKPEAGITFHSQKVEPVAPIRPGSPDEELKGLAYKPVELIPHAPLSLPPTDEARGDKKERPRAPSRSLSGMREVGRVEPSPEYEESRREFRIVEPALPSQPVRFGSVASPVQNRSGEKSGRGAGSHGPVTSQGEPRPRDGATEEPRETPPPGLTRPASPVNEPAFEPISHERFKTEARSYGGITANASETPPNDARRSHRAPIYQERGARVTINQLDIQIINQQPPMPPQPASRTPRNGDDTQTEIDRRLLGRFGLNA